MKLGVIISVNSKDMSEKIKEVKDFGFEYCQLNCWDISLLTDEVADNIKAAQEKYGVTVSTVWCGWNGPRVWNFFEGPITLGLVPAAYRASRLDDLKRGSDFAKKLGVKQLATHVGFIPEDPNEKNYREVLVAIKDIASYCKQNGQYFLFETGQETPVTLLRTILDSGMDNLGINLDPANLILYGKANPVDALDVIGNYVMDVHAKDGVYSTNGRRLGEEVKVGNGKVNFPRFVERLREVGYDKTLIIEREISGEQQKIDIIDTKKYLESLI